MSTSFADLCRDEIHQLHAWFQEWFRGECPDTEREFARVASALAGDFRLVTPAGVVETRETLLDKLRQAHASRVTQFRIWIDEFEGQIETPDLCIATYEEWQEHTVATKLQTTVRLSTAVFRRSDKAPLGVEWLHLHETWRKDQPNELR